MRVKFTIAICALLVLALGASHVQAQSGGFVVLKDDSKVVKYGANQEMGLLEFVYRDNGGVIDDAASLKISYGGLTISDPTDGVLTPTTMQADTTSGIKITCTLFDCGDLRVTAANDEDTKVGTVTITLPTTARPDGGSIVVEGVRTDVSALDVGDEIIASISATEAVGGRIPIGEDRSESIGGVISTVADGFMFEVSKAASRLICNTGTYDHDGDDPDGDGMKPNPDPEVKTSRFLQLLKSPLAGFPPSR